MPGQRLQRRRSVRASRIRCSSAPATCSACTVNAAAISRSMEVSGTTSTPAGRPPRGDRAVRRTRDTVLGDDVERRTHEVVAPSGVVPASPADQGCRRPRPLGLLQRGPPAHATSGVLLGSPRTGHEPSTTTRESSRGAAPRSSGSPAPGSRPQPRWQAGPSSPPPRPPTTVLAPMVTPASTMTPPPSHTLSPMLMGWAASHLSRRAWPDGVGRRQQARSDRSGRRPPP